MLLNHPRCPGKASSAKHWQSAVLLLLLRQGQEDVSCSLSLVLSLTPPAMD